MTTSWSRITGRTNTIRRFTFSTEGFRNSTLLALICRLGTEKLMDLERTTATPWLDQDFLAKGRVDRLIELIQLIKRLKLGFAKPWVNVVLQMMTSRRVSKNRGIRLKRCRIYPSDSLRLTVRPSTTRLGR